MNWVETLTKALVLGIGVAIVWALWRASQAKPLFAVRIVEGRVEKLSGTVTAAFLQRVAELAADHQIDRALIRGYSYGPSIRLRFSKEMGEASRQQLRNWWAANGWGAPYRRPPRCA